jgi:GNAT superfamily N-acetyltransferase
MTEPAPHKLKSPETDEEWHRYHAIRRKVLFENRGLFGIYDEKHPDELRDGHYPMVLVHGGDVIGVIRIDLEGKLAIFRRVAVREDLQYRGHGKIMLSLAEAFARGRGCKLIESSVDPDAVGFYERCGFVRAESTAGGINPMLMSKKLA